MGNDVAGTADARSSENSDLGVCSSLRVQAGRPVPATGGCASQWAAAGGTSCCACRRRPTSNCCALELGVDSLLTEARARAAEQLKTTWPKFSAATLRLPVRMIPFLAGLLAVVTVIVAPGATVLSIAVALPAAFRIWIVLCPVPRPLDGCSYSTSEEEPVYTIIAPLIGEARVSISC